MAAALRRAATRFGAEIAVDQPWTFRPANGRADTGHVTLQTEIPAATQVADYDVLVVADEADEFGAYLEGRTAVPRHVDRAIAEFGRLPGGWAHHWRSRSGLTSGGIGCSRHFEHPFSRVALVVIVVICAVVVTVFFIGFEYSKPNQGALIVSGGSQQTE
ncbi:hypothetical protein [Mesorhizobium sp. B2-1-3A]|uniref:hypothetical protein n=1 Tax=Mesorhizobium sp. B2-1-3A TaxID=2589971 RepID=UPI001FED7B82|nr:hypothetical protein [Mesorhizobium sp. B2-1-3A]